MQLHEMLNELLELIEILPAQTTIKSDYFFCLHPKLPKFIVSKNNLPKFKTLIKETTIYFNQKVSSHFTYQTIERFIKEKLLHSKIENINYTNENTKIFFQPLTTQEPTTLQVIAPITGITLDKNHEPISMGCFEVGHNNHLPETIRGKVSFIYLKANIAHIYDTQMIYQKSPLYFTDFVRILLFIIGDFNNNYIITTQNIAYDIKDDYIETTGGYIYDYYDLNMKSKGVSYTRNLFKILHIDKFSSNIASQKLSILWEFYQQINEDQKLKEITDIQKRILSASLAIGESIRSEETNNSIIYTCIALESLFTKNREEGIRSIISKSLSFLVSANQEQYYNYYKLTTKIYDARSTIVHGRQLSEIPDFNFINKLLRDAIIELLNNEKYKDIETIEQLSEIARATKVYI